MGCAVISIVALMGEVRLMPMMRPPCESTTPKMLATASRSKSRRDT